MPYLARWRPTLSIPPPSPNFFKLFRHTRALSNRPIFVFSVSDRDPLARAGVTIDYYYYYYVGRVRVVVGHRVHYNTGYHVGRGVARSRRKWNYRRSEIRRKSFVRIRVCVVSSDRYANTDISVPRGGGQYGAIYPCPLSSITEETTDE